MSTPMSTPMSTAITEEGIPALHHCTDLAFEGVYSVFLDVVLEALEVVDERIVPVRRFFLHIGVRVHNGRAERRAARPVSGNACAGNQLSEHSWVRATQLARRHLVVE